MQKSTLVFVFKGNGSSVLLARKKRGCGLGKLNAPGGKMCDGDASIESCAVREVYEEVGLTIPEARLLPRGVIEFNFPNKLVWSNQCHLYVVYQREDSEFGEPIESDEMAPRWVSVDALPYDEMWADDRIWLPRVLNGESVQYRFWHDHETSEILRHEMLQ